MSADDPRITIVVVPYRQLITEAVKDACQVGIDCIVWTLGCEDPAAVAVVSADQLGDCFSEICVSPHPREVERIESAWA